MASKTYTINYGKVVNQLNTNVTLMYEKHYTNTIAMWDTGADVSIISARVAGLLGLTSNVTTEIASATNVSQQHVYYIDVILPQDIIIRGLRVIDAPIERQGVDMLIGMDIIGAGNFSVNNVNGETVMSFTMEIVEQTGAQPVTQ